MTLEGAGNRAARPWRGLRRLSSRTPLRTKLIAALGMLVILALAAISSAGIMILRNYLLGQTDSSLPGYARDAQANEVPNYLTTGLAHHTLSNVTIYWLPSGGQLAGVLTPGASPGSGGPMPSSSPLSPPVLSGAASWLAANPLQPMTVPGQSGGGRGRGVGLSSSYNNSQGNTITRPVVAAGGYRGDGGRDRGRAPEPASARTGSADRDRQPGPFAEHHAEPDRDRVPRAGGIRGGGASVRGADAAVHRRCQPRAAYAADRHPRFRRVLPAARRARPALGQVADSEHGRGGQVRCRSCRARDRAHPGRPGPDHAAGGEGSRPDGLARRGPAAAGPARPAAAAGPAADRPALAGGRCGARHPDARARPDHQSFRATRRGVPRHRGRATAAAGYREPDEQCAHPHP